MSKVKFTDMRKEGEKIILEFQDGQGVAVALQMDEEHFLKGLLKMGLTEGYLALTEMAQKHYEETKVGKVAMNEKKERSLYVGLNRPAGADSKPN